ncbi:hypothetical protein KR51_00022980 [Rubidibacter lacunae KORDI 51-2]|uniref:Uncharacterized protein n=1 Tax=Rubidibacter lacunae KORDI 51-2 TaxID=582515 RepID=U5DHE8_9CHRO|nr:hypothetical protein KR51_00022980 [Rubidibacter lacunae KORDI 51-2]
MQACGEILGVSGVVSVSRGFDLDKQALAKIGFAEKVHKTNLGGRELMESGFYHLAPAFCLGFSAQVQGF